MTMLKNREFKGQAAPEWATAVTKLNGFWYWEESIEQKLGDRFCRCGVNFEDYTRTYGPSTSRGYAIMYLLPPLETEDDPLPPAPKGALYINSAGWGLKVEQRTHTELLIATGDPQKPNRGWVGATIDPDTALQLAHDLRRMAMDIKRKQKEVD